jgi:hypothetical protein
MATKAATNALAMLRGERAPNCLNPEVYDGEAYRKRSAERGDASRRRRQ